ncbi:STAS domain-containing protein [Actinokineospora auranticolor]|uniref:Anti-sigma factor antagonist n=1 Tax=Actinokineospora auranticolor TaxID=155976 RepID=A0A2S6GDN1_9PSEU|nr:STAS domain-containing protein [Actinokineospora auranticolor]PPK63323.1 anti-anti-sigma factor [Actinokineospora auranticolor]
MSILFTVSIEQTPDRTVLHARGEVDMGTVSTLTDALDTALTHDPAPPVVVVDFTEVTFLASAGLAALVSANQRARTTGSGLVVVTPKGSVTRRAITVSSLEHVLTLAEEHAAVDVERG